MSSSCQAVQACARSLSLRCLRQETRFIRPATYVTTVQRRSAVIHIIPNLESVYVQRSRTSTIVRHGRQLSTADRFNIDVKVPLLFQL